MNDQKIIINPQGTRTYTAVFLDRIFTSFIVKLLFFFSWVGGLASIIIVIGAYLNLIMVEGKTVGLSLIVLSFFLVFIALRSFYFGYLKIARTVKVESAGTNENFFELFSFELAKATYQLFIKKGEYTTKDLVKSILETDQMKFIMLRLGLGSNFLEAIKNYSGEKGVEKVVLHSLEIAAKEKHSSIEIGDVFLSLCLSDSLLKKLVEELNLTPKDIANVIHWQVNESKKYERKSFFNPESIKLTGGIGKDWAFGWTPFLKQFSLDLTEWIRSGNMGLEIIGHEKQIDGIKEALLKGQGGNVLIVGSPGVGKKTVVLGFAKKVMEGQTNSALDFQHVFKVDTEILLSGIESMGEIASRITGIFQEAAAAGNIIIYIENFQNLLSSGDPGKVNVSEVILPLLESSGMHVIGTCDVASFNKYISPNSALSQHFERVSVDEPNNDEMIRILEDTVPEIEYRTKSIISYEAIKETISAADKYVMDIPDPEKSIKLLDAASARANSERGKTIILPKDIMEYVTEKYDIPSSEVDNTEKEKLLALEEIMHKRVIGQTEAISAISNALRRVRAGITDSKKPIGSFLFLGPTGVGKTETCKALAEAYFGGEDRMIRFDMSEYQHKEDIYRLIGSDVDEMQGELTTAVREKPFSLLLFDEIEKAHPNILDLFLQMLDEGFLTDGSGRKVIFTNAIIIATSNAGANLIRESIKDGQEYAQVKQILIDFIQKEGIYRPEFLNRFTGIVAFSPLSQDEIKQVAEIMISKLKETVSKNKGINLSILPDAVEKLSQLGFNPEMGARPMARAIEEKIENTLATKILSGEIKKGDSITISGQDIT